MGIIIKKLKNKLIKLLGGYTRDEYKVIVWQHEKFISEGTNDKNTQIANEAIARFARDMLKYAQNVLYGLEGNEWSKRFYCNLHNNWLRLLCFYLANGNSHTIYTFNPNLDSRDKMVRLDDQLRQVITTTGMSDIEIDLEAINTNFD